MIILFCVVGIAVLLSLRPVSAFLLDILQFVPPVSAEELEQAGHGPPCAIVILSAGRRRYAPEYGGETLDAPSLERVRYGALLAHKTGLPVLVSGGAIGCNETTLARLMADTLLSDYNVNTRWLESRSRSTVENAAFSMELLRQAGIDRVVLVTHAWHVARARLRFMANGAFVIPAPTAFYRPPLIGVWSRVVPTVEALRMSTYAIHEMLGIAWYAVRYGQRRAR